MPPPSPSSGVTHAAIDKEFSGAVRDYLFANPALMANARAREAFRRRMLRIADLIADAHTDAIEQHSCFLAPRFVIRIRTCLLPLLNHASR